MITVQIIAHSVANGVEIATIAAKYPRFIHAEVMTHRVFSRNSASSRAIPIKAAIENIRQDPAQVVFWGKKQSGMAASTELTGWRLRLAKANWAIIRELVILGARIFDAVGLHKQIACRMLEPFQNINVLITSTEWANFLALRDHPSAQPEIQELARQIKKALKYSKASQLHPGQWHIPFFMPIGEKWMLRLDNSIKTDRAYTTAEALKISASLCAQYSYRKSDTSVEKAEAVYKQLVECRPVHASPFEHQARAMTSSTEQEGLTHIDIHGNMWSGNLRGWIQHRQLIPHNVIREKQEGVENE